MRSHHDQQQQQQQMVGHNSSTWPRHHRRHNDTDYNDDDVSKTTRRRRDDEDGVPDGRSKNDEYVHGGGDRVNAGPQPVRVDPVRGHSPRRRRRLVRGLDSDNGALADDEDAQDVEAEYLESSEERDELRALRSDAGAPAGGMRPDSLSRHHPVTMTTTMTSSATSTSQPSRRLTLPSIVKYPDVSSATPTASSSNTRQTGTSCTGTGSLYDVMQVGIFEPLPALKSVKGSNL